MDTNAVFATDDLAEASRVRDLLEANGIMTMVQGMNTQNLFGGMKPFTGMDLLAGSIRILVKEEDIDRSLVLLDGHDLGGGGEGAAADADGADEAVEAPDKPYAETAAGEAFYRKRTMFFALLLASLSFFILPALGNIPVLIKLRATNPAIALGLSAITAILALLGVYAFAPFFSGR